MASDDMLHDTTPTAGEEMVESTGEVAADTPPTEHATDGFPNRWAGGPDDSAAAGTDFGENWSGGPDGSTEKAEEFGQAWSGVPSDQSESAEKFGTAWSGDNEETPGT